MPSNVLPPGGPPEASQALVSALARCDTLWLHGAGLAGDTWGPIASGYPRAVTPDLPGHGAAAPVTPPRVETFADALSAHVRPGTALIGHSLGGMVALELAARLPDRVSALVMIETVPTVRDRLSGRISAGFASGLLRTLPTSWLARLTGLGEGPETRTELRRQMARTDRGRIAAALEAAARYDGRRHLPSIRAPTLLIVGRKNAATHHGTALMAAQIPGATRVTLPGGHMLHTDNPVQLRRCIDGFLSRSVPG